MAGGGLFLCEFVESRVLGVSLVVLVCLYWDCSGFLSIGWSMLRSMWCQYIFFVWEIDVVQVLK